ncbi:hypothetical protein DFQ27_004238 [Actinomortierella ambigua]|uniref:Cyanovirin-N domain-containing protein n=1 Tax=Actinomortierella ambigua TaxID=1343610 RepID=A0A9P6Q447_9FUNG|nr:hypothetical protein DFQ27_004238 [Actinomortierella ambigua]
MHFHGIAILLSLTTAALSAPVSGGMFIDPEITVSCRAFEMLKDKRTVKAICLSEVETTINTLDFLGNNYGQFEWDGEKNWWENGSGDPVLEGSVLTAGLFTRNGKTVNATVDLAERIKNIDGKLTYSVGSPTSQVVNPDISKSCRDFLFVDGHVLTAVCLTEVSTKIDTYKILGNEKGQFRWGKKKWSKYASKVKLTSENGPVITAMLKYKGKMRTDSVKLDERIKNIDGKLTYYEYRWPTPFKN